LCGLETWPVAVKDKGRVLRIICDNERLSGRRLKKVYCETLYNAYCSRNIIMEIKRKCEGIDV
jgi:hypothetical protein